MNDQRNWADPLNDLELLVRAAGDYVQPSSDLRPRVLETARATRGDRQSQRLLRQIAVLVLLLGAWLALRPENDVRQDAWHLESAAIRDGSQSRHTTGGMSSEIGWSTVERFTEFRRRQAEVLRPTL